MNVPDDILRYILEFSMSLKTVKSLMLTNRETYINMRNDNFIWFMFYKYKKDGTLSSKHIGVKSINCFINTGVHWWKNNLCCRMATHFGKRRNLNKTEMRNLEIKYYDDQNLVESEEFKEFIEEAKCNIKSHRNPIAYAYNSKWDYYDKVSALAITKLKKIKWTDINQKCLEKLNEELENTKEKIRQLEERKRMSNLY